MTGNYMNAPATRQAWDRDGSVLAYINNLNAISTGDVAARRIINNELEDGVALSNMMRVVVVFPIPMDMTALFVALTVSNAFTVETSKDSTTGIDGSWDAQGLAGQTANNIVNPAYRTASYLKTLLPDSTSHEVRAIRFSFAANTSFTFKGLHLYGKPSSIASIERLEIWDGTLDQRIDATHFDWGDVPRGTTADQTFRIKNLSATQTANGIDVYVETLTPTTPTTTGMHTFSENGGSTFLTTLSFASLAPGEITPELIVRRVIPTDAVVSLWSVRLVADVTSWS